MLEKLLRSKAEVGVLGVVLFNEGLHLREIARQASVSPSEARRELGILSEAGVLKSERRGNQTIFSINPSCQFIKELKTIYRKTEGAIPEMKNALHLVPGIKYALVFGSTASGSDSKRSDMDLLVVGAPNDDFLSRTIFNLQKKHGQEINFISWSEHDLAEKTKGKNAFLQNIIKGRRIWLFGDEHEFVRIAKG